jgi:hypothetical protein
MTTFSDATVRRVGGKAEAELGEIAMFCSLPLPAGFTWAPFLVPDR